MRRKSYDQAGNCERKKSGQKLRMETASLPL
jgi:hypothetical protein